MSRKFFRVATLTFVLATPAVTMTTTACGKSIGNTIDDATITGRVKTALLNDRDVPGLSIDVDTFKGVVTLSGGVKSQYEAQRAVQIAKRTPGVVSVKSTLQVTA